MIPKRLLEDLGIIREAGLIAEPNAIDNQTKAMLFCELTAEYLSNDEMRRLVDIQTKKLLINLEGEVMEWISVKDRLPEPYSLCYTVNKKFMILKDCKTWHVRKYGITHWSIPKPPEGVI